MSHRSRLVAGDRILDLAPLIHDERPVREDRSPDLKTRQNDEVCGVESFEPGPRQDGRRSGVN